MNSELINRYQQGGDIYAQLVNEYGVDAANTIAAAAMTGDSHNVTAAIAEVRSGPVRDDSIWSILGNQLVTDPLAAPLQSAETIASNSFMALLKSPAVLAIGAAVLFVALGGVTWLRNIITKK